MKSYRKKGAELIKRYTRAEMGKIWEPEARFKHMLEVEVAVAEVQARMRLIPREAAVQIRKKGKFSIERIDEIEQTTKHDVIAFVSCVAENVGPMGRYIHYGMTSSDVLDTALSLQIRAAGEVLKKSVLKLKKALAVQAKKHALTLCAGRTHGMHAEPTSFGLKLSGFLAELVRAEERLDRALEQMNIGKLSGAVGTYSSMTPEFEKKVCKELGLKPETVATQVIPRDRHAEVFFALSGLGNFLERLSIELRHLQRTEVGEVLEGFSKGQKGSSAMPHKRNPISAENLTGVARLLRSYLQAALEDVALWHERDISHSSVERVIFPDAFIICDYAVDRMATVITNLEVRADQMQKNMELSQGTLFSSHLLLRLVEAGLSREEAYTVVQGLSHGLGKNEHLKTKALKDSVVKEKLKPQVVKDVFTGKSHLKGIKTLVTQVLQELK